jgi:hypothetical protein
VNDFERIAPRMFFRSELKRVSASEKLQIQAPAVMVMVMAMAG